MLLRRAAREAAAAGTPPPFRLRPGLIVQMLAFYDELRRREQSLDDFERLAVGGSHRAPRSIAAPSGCCARPSSSSPRSRLRAAHAAQTGCIDEHGLRALLLDPDSCRSRAYRARRRDGAGPGRRSARPLRLRLRPPHPARRRHRDRRHRHREPAGAGFHERFTTCCPDSRKCGSGRPPSRPGAGCARVAPSRTQRWFVSRDREEELTRVRPAAEAPRGVGARVVRPPALDRFGDRLSAAAAVSLSGPPGVRRRLVPYQALDALPLSAEPFAAMIDVIFSFLSSEGNRTLHRRAAALASPRLQLEPDAQEVAALDTTLLRPEVLGRMGPARRAFGDRRLGRKAAGPERGAGSPARCRCGDGASRGSRG